MSDQENPTQEEVPNDVGDSHDVDSSDNSMIQSSSVTNLGDTVALPIIVAIGASAGGLEAIEVFFRHMPAHTGMAFVIVQHLDPHYPSMMPDIIQRYTEMPVNAAGNDLMVEPNHIYVIPPNAMLGLFNGALQLLGPTEQMQVRLPIDYLFRSLARDVRDRCVAIVLSGAGSDGSLGLKAVKEAGGMVMVQDPASASYDGMPRSAISTAMVDYILPPDVMPEQIINYWTLVPSNRTSPVTVKRQAKMSDSIQQILFMIRTQTGHDFSQYKQTTIRRRIERLMAVNHLETLDDYVHFLQNNTVGVEVLFRDLLIGVTNFFRDKEVFESIRTTLVPQLFLNRRPDEPLRIWVPGCSTGEEAYSIAILLREYMRILRQEYQVQIFATDIDTHALSIARIGAYSANIAMDVPEEYLQQYFLPLPDGSYQITKSVREMLVFAPHSVIKDPPFSKLDMISCRNLLIYLTVELQEQVLSYFHFALVPMGFLVLGASESVGHYEEELSVVDIHHKIYQRPQNGTSPRYKPNTTVTPATTERAHVKTMSPQTTNLRQLTETMLLTQWTPTCIIINTRGHMRYIHGNTEKYLTMYSGEIDQLDIVQSAREDLKGPLRSAIYRAAAQQKEVHEKNILIEFENNPYVIDLIVRPLTESVANENLLAVFFQEVKGNYGADDDESMNMLLRQGQEPRYQQLQQEMMDMRAYLQTTIEELKSSNEEMQLINEELQSVNEELQTSQEELRAVNEELLSSNAELEQKVEEVTWANNDLSNTLNALQTGIILLDSDFNIRRFNPAATQVFKLIPSDVGRSITDIVSDFKYDTLLQDIEKVFSSLISLDVDVQTRQGRWYALQIRPYRTLQNAIKGVVIYFNDVTARK
jgi:two-component system, chemotaxis family, CheB/CheR fusion protein